MARMLNREKAWANEIAFSTDMLNQVSVIPRSSDLTVFLRDVPRSWA